ncbi:MAG: hypothetical protein HPY69_04320 [Armatimonadetes bacterium]|nr:hypothetical protein [Armatimonadota bacterium]
MMSFRWSLPLLALAATPGALAAGPDDPSPFGIVCPWPTVGETGARWVRCGAGATQLVDWGRVEPEPGQFVWEAADSELADWDRPEGLTPLPILGYTAPWASSDRGGARSYPPRDLRHYARFVRESVTRYRQDIRYWEVWNEPNIGFFHGTITQYVDMLKAAAIVARRANPGCHIVFGGTAGVDCRFLERCYELGAAPYFDVMAVHPYQWGRTFDDRWHMQKVQAVRSLMAQQETVAKPIWFTEIGWSTNEGVTPEDQARLLVQAFVSSLALRDLGVAKVFWFCVKDWGGPGHGLFADDGSRKPAFKAYQSMTRELEGLVPHSRLVADQARGYLFADPRHQRAPVLVYWSPGLETASLRLPPLGDVTQVDLYGTEEPLSLATEADELLARPEPHYLRLRPGAVGQLQDTGAVEALANPTAGYWQAPRTPPPPPCWASVQIPAGTERLWLTAGGKREVRVNLWNLDDRPRQARLTLSLLGASRTVARTLPPWAMQPVTVALPVAADAPLGLKRLAVALELSNGHVRPEHLVYTTPVRLAAGPTVEFLANSHLERSVYLQPGARSGESESCRFGSEWTYRFEAPYACDGQLGVYLGAHRAGPFALAWSQDGKHWQTVLEGRGNRAWRETTLSGVQAGPVYLRVSGTDVQLEELVLTWPQPR